MDEWDIPHEYMRTMEGVRRLPWDNLLKDVSKREFMCLEMIRHFQKGHPDIPGIYITKLAADLRITKSGVSKLLHQLEARDLIQRVVDTKDRRNTFVSLTQTGNALCCAQHKRWCAFMHRVADQLGEQHFRMILAGIRELTQAMAHEIDAVEPADSDETKEETRCGLF